MKKIVYLLVFLLLLVPCCPNTVQASLVSDKNYRKEQKKIEKKEFKQIETLFAIHTIFANEHDIENLKTLYADNYINNDGFNKEVSFKNIEQTWEECKDLTYKVQILSSKIDNDFAAVEVAEYATGTIMESFDGRPAAGEIHSSSKEIYYLTKVNDKWLISGENVISDESSLLYGDARFMSIELQAPDQVSSGESYTATVKVNSDDNIYMIGSIEHDPVTYPAGKANAPLRVVPQSNILERIIKANTDNLNEYAVASLAISKTKNEGLENFKIYMAGLACVMKRVNVIPKNNFIKLEDKNENSNR